MSSRERSLAAKRTRRILVSMRLVPLLAVILLCGAPIAIADARGEPVEAAIRVPGIDAQRFVAELARRTLLRLVLVDPSAERRSRARLELAFDKEKGTARVAYHDGASDAPALVVVAHFASGTDPGERWLLTQAESAIRSFRECEESMSGPSEVLNPWSPEETAGRQRWAEVLDPWFGCSVERSTVARAVPDWPSEFGDPILEGEVLDPWLEAAYEERAVALTAPRPGVPPREMKPHRSE
jgi:hypothetical protein